MTRDCKNELLKTWKLVGKLRQIMEKQMVTWLNPDNQEKFMKLLEEYQQSVITVGDTIDRCANEEESGAVIPGLQEYCEEIYQMVNCMGEASAFRKQLETLRRTHRHMGDILEKMPVRTEMLFLPYKFSMWDCLESVYLAADKDESCDAVVMPIPYVEQNKEKEAEWRYEANDFKGIPVVSFKEYNIDEHKPDVIFIHNPYDGYNNVTSIAAEYHSSELKKFCRFLVYIPYFYVGAEMPHMHLSLPPYENMDYIVVPSQFSVEQMSPYVPKKKLLPLGSPKVDRMLAMNEKREMPGEWKKQIEGKKAVLYNVGINGLLQNGFRTIFKMRYVFDYFKKQSDLVLWWRPHPLLKATVKSMKPELLPAYEEMEKAFLLERIGIYDITPDSNMAIAATDAFLGDYSSMVSLYGLLGKPIFLLDNFSMTEPEEIEKRLIWIGGPVREADGNFIFYSSDYRAICRLHIESGEIEFLHRMDGNYAGGQGFYFDDPEKAELRYFPFERQKPTVVYHMADGTITQTEAPEDELLYTYYSNIWEIGDETVFCPGAKPEFVFWNRVTGKVSRYKDYEKELLPYVVMTGERLFAGGAARVGDCAYMLSYRTNKLLEFNLTDKSWELYDIGEDEMSFSSFLYDGADFWFFAWDGSCVVRWYMEDHETEYYSRMPEGYLGLCSSMASPYTPAFGSIVLLPEEIIVFPHIANMILRVNRVSGEISEWRPRLFYEEGQRKSSLYHISSNYIFACLYDENHIMAQTAYDGSLLIIDIVTGEVERKNCVLSKEEYAKLDTSVEGSAYRTQALSPYYYQENGLHQSLGDMMRYLVSGADLQEERQKKVSTEGVENADGSCGKKVYDKMKELLERK
ncbi:MAG: CDP-glycerol glycerophosphotransferase family protein [Clostridium sp.]|nr:CDP-glycerol glycerophosphotransferase family protein [Clostridium sp.]